MVAALADQPTLDPLDEAEVVILELCRVILGDGRKDRGLLTYRAKGRNHVPTCSRGMWLSPTSPRPDGDPCNARCDAVHEAINAAERWLIAREVAR